jgi:hypothetical protein
MWGRVSHIDTLPPTGAIGGNEMLGQLAKLGSELHPEHPYKQSPVLH